MTVETSLERWDLPSPGDHMPNGAGGKPDPQLVQEAVRRIVEVAHPVEVLLFGSAARGEMGTDRDLDFLVVVRGPVNRGDIAGRIYEHMVGVGSAVDVTVVTPEDIQENRHNPGMILGEALEEGEVVYGP